ncbi:MAG: hypothetical protein P1U87_23050, partial [Verrucomicrobiales bacterium]|nr:hypothetical protein [Verrucomicrobiales bacterium]
EDQFSYRDVQPRSIFRGAQPGETIVGEVIQPEQEAQPMPAPPRRSGGGIFSKIFKKKNR